MPPRVINNFFASMYVKIPTPCFHASTAFIASSYLVVARRILSLWEMSFQAARMSI